jgi:hypothetical protein
VLRQYELRERHFECVVRSKELEVLLSRARAAEQKQLAEVEKLRGDKLEEEVRPAVRQRGGGALMGAVDAQGAATDAPHRQAH